jgi:hypothetical protein
MIDPGQTDEVETSGSDDRHGDRRAGSRPGRMRI